MPHKYTDAHAHTIYYTLYLGDYDVEKVLFFLLRFFKTINEIANIIALTMFLFRR